MSSKIIGIQFSIMPPSDIRNGVVEVTSRDTYVSNKPVIGGLFDPRMGVLEHGYVCPTDGLDNMSTPGYHGYLELARPIFYIQYLVTVVKILKCVCFKCSALLIDPAEKTYGTSDTGGKGHALSYILNMPPEARWKYICGLCKKAKRCFKCDSVVPIGITKSKNEVATILAEWKTTGPSQYSETENLVVKCTPEVVLKIFTRITDDDIRFMGFDPIWSRPEWMICQVMMVPPPAVRPSVRTDGSQRSEDDLTHILVNIIKYNKLLFDKIRSNEPENLIDDLTSTLTFYACTQINNKLPGVPPVSQRSGRPLKSISERLNGKGGRMRGNLMAKRVDFSARTVIGAEPNISIREIGVPIRIAKNITKPVKVNARNYDFCVKLVQNGPNEYPGAKTVVQSNGNTYNLRYMDRTAIKLNIGDIVHRHMMEGDPVLFNRQPSLHRMSMMCHTARIMMVGDTFRMNVADTKPYNADFDGDEMNLHMPQDVESTVELAQLAAVPYQIISPANNSPIIGIFQDNLIGAHLFTRANIRFSKKVAMNLLMSAEIIDYDFTNPNPTISSFEVLSNIMPAISLHTLNKFWTKDEDMATSNNIIDIQNGDYLRGQLEKGVLGGGSKSIIQRVCNDYGNIHASNFIDNLQNVITEYMKVHSFSVGISDLTITAKTIDDITNIIANQKSLAQALLEQSRLGLLENHTGKTNEDELEQQLDDIIKKASSDAGRSGLQGLASGNRFVTMVNSGSKGTDLNLTQMVSCVGQQTVDGKRIPYGFDNRTLPHFTKADDGLDARGFVENSYITGLSPSEVFFHAMGGRTGLIDTAVKTSQTGYIQRRIIKALEDLMVHYDGTVRGSKNGIIQFSYGEDGIDTIKVELQAYPVLEMSIESIYAHFNVPAGTLASIDKYFTSDVAQQNHKTNHKYGALCKQYTALLIDTIPTIIRNVFKGNFTGTPTVQSPIAFSYIINNISLQMNGLPYPIDITLHEAFEMIVQTYENIKLLRYCQPTLMFEVLYFYYLSPKQLLLVKRFNRASLTMLLATIYQLYQKAIVTPGEMVGMIAAQSIGEVSTQMTLNTFHFAGVGSKSNVTRGVPRLEELLTLTDNPKNPSLTIYLKPEDQTNKERAVYIMHELEHTLLKHIVRHVEIYFDPNDELTNILEDREMVAQYKYFNRIMNADPTCSNNKYSKWVIRITLDPAFMLDKNITMEDVSFILTQKYKDTVQCMYSDYNADNLIFRIRISTLLKSAPKNSAVSSNLVDTSDQLFIIKGFQDSLMSTIIKGVKNLSKVILRKTKEMLKAEDGVHKSEPVWVLDTVGTNLLTVLGSDSIDKTRTFSNDVIEIYYTLGIEAARQAIYNEIVDVITFDGTYINAHHYSILCDRMTYSNKLISVFRFGLNKDNIGPIAKASFEETPEMLLRAARFGELDNMRGVSANVMCGQEGYYGTSAFQVMFDTEKYIDFTTEQSPPPSEEPVEDKNIIEPPEGDTVDDVIDTKCNASNIIIRNNNRNIRPVQFANSAVSLDF
jgi:DNA-directed RNA polymerase II subunit RPB1